MIILSDQQLRHIVDEDLIHKAWSIGMARGTLDERCKELTNGVWKRACSENGLKIICMYYGGAYVGVLRGQTPLLQVSELINGKRAYGPELYQYGDRYEIVSYNDEDLNWERQIHEIYSRLTPQQAQVWPVTVLPRAS
jgi:hypothetical protein